MSARQRDLLLTAVLLAIGVTPAWFLPPWLSVPWQLVFLIAGPPALWYSWHHAPWQPTPRAELARLMTALELTSGERFCDLGAGDGRIVAWLHDRTGADCTGIEASPLPWVVALLRLWRRPGARVVFGDLYRADLSAYDAVYVWGVAYSVATPRFGAHVRAAMRPGARLVSYHYPVHGMEPVGVDREGQRPLFRYVIPGG